MKPAWDRHNQQHGSPATHGVHTWRLVKMSPLSRSTTNPVAYDEHADSVSNDLVCVTL